MAYQLPIKYYNAFWLKKVVGSSETNSEGNNASTVTTTAKIGGDNTKENVNEGKYMMPTWPGIPWGDKLSKADPSGVNPNVLMPYPCFPWGGRNWNSYNPINGSSTDLPSCGGSLVSRNPTQERGKERQWAIEEARIFGGYNNTTVDFGGKAFIVEDNNQRTIRSASMIYSGIFNSLTGINNTNVFSTANPITKSVDPESGSIQKLYAYDTNLTIFQENKVSKALINKDAIYSAEGVGTPVTSTKLVIGQIVPYVGEYGISKNPESWAQFGFRQYFTDKYRNSVMRLSRDGLTEISSYGMTDYFRDRFSTIIDEPIRRAISFKYFDEGLVPEQRQNAIEVFQNSDCPTSNILIGSSVQINNIQIPGLFVTSVNQNVSGTIARVGVSLPWRPGDFGVATYTDLRNNFPVTFVTYVYDKLLGGFDNHNKNYVLAIKDGIADPCVPVVNTRETGDNLDYTDRFRTYNTFNTLNFDENINGWVSFYSYNPTIIGSLKNEFYTVKDFDLYQHYKGGQLNHGNFYGVHYNSSIEFIFNPKATTSKNFQTVSYEGSNGWQLDYFVSDSTAALYNTFSGTYYPAQDTVNFIPSLNEGEYVDTVTGLPQHAGFYLKENKYVANLINSSQPIGGEVLSGQSMSGIKGYYTTVKLSTDNSTQVGGAKELYCVSSKFVVSSQ